ncbi:MAG: hypothetical protein Q7J06_10420 [Bacteroidales bacterium]|nr:hypothetical protein [Bacteroidales bacterium]
MIGNKYLQALFDYPDEDTSINQLLELLKSKDSKFLNSLSEAINFELCSEEEIKFLTKVSALIDYSLQQLNIDVPEWLRDDKLSFDKPYYYSKRISDTDKIRLLSSCPAPFRLRNVYFDMESIKRV